ncbi:hypothetical protein V5799_007003 [Amblyomma americanum]|uniref:Uncharacterized protein n=1 Tax=Amblyomma americanum TaxID=6943 RepID=A0AAQ4DUS5_AMBAM
MNRLDETMEGLPSNLRSRATGKHRRVGSVDCSRTLHQLYADANRILELQAQAQDFVTAVQRPDAAQSSSGASPPAANASPQVAAPGTVVIIPVDAGEKSSILFLDTTVETPSLHLGYALKKPDQSRYHRRKARSHRQFSSAGAVGGSARDEPATSEDASMCDEGTEPLVCSLADTACQTDLGAADIRGLEDQISGLRQQLQASEEASRSTSFIEEALHGCDERVAFYTGLPTFVMLHSLFKLVKDHISHSRKHSLTQFQEMVLFLMRMRLGC